MNPLVPWDIGLFMSGIKWLTSAFGTAINIGIWIFILISGVYLVAKIISSLGK